MGKILGNLDSGSGMGENAGKFGYRSWSGGNVGKFGCRSWNGLYRARGHIPVAGPAGALGYSRDIPKGLRVVDIQGGGSDCPRSPVGVPVSLAVSSTLEERKMKAEIHIFLFFPAFSAPGGSGWPPQAWRSRFPIPNLLEFAFFNLFFFPGAP